MNYFYLFCFEVVFFYVVLKLLYLAQIKEYRLDRLRVAFEEFGWKTFGLSKGKLPSTSVRNILIVLGIISSNILFLSIFELNIFWAMMGVFLATFDLIFWVILTGILSKMWRERQIQKAYGYLEILKKMQKVPMQIIAVTGSTGKSTQKEYLGEFFAQFAESAKTVKNHNTDIGIAQDILKKLGPSTRYFVAEIGTYRRGEIEAVVERLRPNVAIITSITDQHLGILGSFENLVKAKMEIATYLGKDDVLVYPENLHDVIVKYWRELYRDLQLKGVKIFQLKNTYNPLDFFQQLMIVLEQVYNLDPKIAKKAFEKISQIPVRPLRQNIAGKITFLDDSGSTSSLSLLHALNVFDKFNTTTQSNKYFVTRGIIELGKAKSEVYEKITTRIMKIHKGKILLLDEQLYHLLEERGFENMMYFANEQNLLLFLQENLSAGDLLYLTGRYTDKFLYNIKNWSGEK